MLNFLRKIKRAIFPPPISNDPHLYNSNLNFSGKTDAGYYKELLTGVETNKLIADAILKNKPFIVSRLGATELKIVNNYIVKNISDYNHWNHDIVEEGFTHSGIFPNTDVILNNFSDAYLSAIKDIDLIGVWNNVGENFLLKMLTPSAMLCELIDLEPFFHEAPWSCALEGKKVLVIHPFSSTIKMQYQFRKQIFANNLLPEFQLETLSAVQSLSGHDTRFSTWFEALNWMKGEIEKKEFDVAIIGAGAYGLSLASHVKKMQKTAIHLGGASQLLFGIKGKRWSDIPQYAALMNDYWVGASPDEIPPKGNLVDGYGPYWDGGNK